MSVTPFPSAPTVWVPPVVDRVHSVIDLLPTYIELAERIANTEFVPKDLRRRPEAVLAALMSGAERGLGPMESLRSVHVIEGRPSLSAEAMRALVMAAGHEIEIVESTAQRATLVGRRKGSTSTSPPFTWTMDRARRARLVNKDNWVKFPESMLLARASTELCKAVFPDIIAGLASTEELIDEYAAPETTTTTRRAPARRLSRPAAAPAPALAPAVAPASREGSPAAVAVVDVDEGQAHENVVAHDVELGDDGIPGSGTPTWGSTPAPAPEPAPHDPTLAKRIHAEIAKTFPQETGSTRDRWRHALVAVVTRKRAAGPVTSSSDLDLEEQMALSELLTRIAGGSATVADGPDDTVELRAGGGWRYTIDTLDPPAVTVRQGDDPAATNEEET